MAISHIEMDIADVMMERPLVFSIGRRQYCLYPSTLGKMQLAIRLLESSGITVNGESNVNSLDLLFITGENKEICCRLIAYYTLPGMECLNENAVSKRIKEIKKLDNKGIATLVSTILTSDKYSVICGHYGIDKERKRLETIMRAKKGDNSTIVIGGKSVWGSLIDCACERYGWSFQYVVWGISYCNLMLLLTDQYRTIYLTEKERKDAHISTDDVVIKITDTENLNNFIKHNVWS